MTQGRGRVHEQAAYEGIIRDLENIDKLKLEDLDQDSISTRLPGKTTRARWLAEEAKRLTEEESNEPGWRAGIESEIFCQFDVNIDCEKCGQKYWLCRRPVSFDEGNDQLRLGPRRNARKLCDCKPDDQPRGRCDMKTSPCFASVFDESVYQGYETFLKLNGRKPDRVYGLRNIEALLRQVNDNANPKNDVKSSSFQKSIKHIHFPFLLLEAKSKKSSSNFDKIFKQSEGSIRAILKLQHDLIARVRIKRESIPISTGPIVWFFAFNGECWRLTMCYTYDRSESSRDHGTIRKEGLPGDERYGSKIIWTGDITEVDGAIRLFELIEYVFDWARDAYRQSIIFYLNALPRSELNHVDRAIASLKQPSPPQKANQSGSKRNLGRSKLPKASKFRMDLAVKGAKKLLFPKSENSELGFALFSK